MTLGFFFHGGQADRLAGALQATAIPTLATISLLYNKVCGGLLYGMDIASFFALVKEPHNEQPDSIVADDFVGSPRLTDAIAVHLVVS